MTETADIEVVSGPPYERLQLRGAAALLWGQLVTGERLGAELLLEGRAGTGKTMGILAYLVQAAFMWPRSRILLCRATRTALTQSVLPTLEEEILGLGHPAVVGGPTRAYRESYQLGQSELVLGSLDTPDERLFSTNWDLIYVAEAIETSLDSWELFGRAQRPRSSPDGAPWKQRIADCNPGPPSHWLNERATEVSPEIRRVKTAEEYDRLQAFNGGAQGGRMRRLISVHQDNPQYWDWAAWDWTDDGRVMLEGLMSMSGHRRRRMLEGEWVAAEGSVFPEFDVDRHVMPAFAVPSSWPVTVWLDPGYDHPCAILWIAVGPAGRAYVVHESYRSGKGVPEHAQEIQRVNAKMGWSPRAYYADPQHAFSHTAQSPLSISQQFRKCGITFWPWPRSSNKQGMVEAVRRRLVDASLVVFAECRHTIAEFQSWSYKRTMKGEVPTGDDAYEDKNNHAMDAICGAVSQGLYFSGAGGGLRVVKLT